MSWISVWLTVLEDQVRWAEHCRYRMRAGLAGRGAVWLGGAGRGAKHGWRLTQFVLSM